MRSPVVREAGFVGRTHRVPVLGVALPGAVAVRTPPGVLPVPEAWADEWLAGADEWLAGADEWLAGADA